MTFLFRACFFQIILLILTFQPARAQDATQIIDEVNLAVEKLTHLHFKAIYNSKYFSSADTSHFECENWIIKTKSDSFLGMHIRSKQEHETGFKETFHKDSITWLILHALDTIIKYNQSKGDWDGFKGNIKRNWTTETVLSTGIVYDETVDSLAVRQLETGDWLIERFQPENEAYSITDIKNTWWIDQRTMLPYRYVNQWKIGDRETYNCLELELLDSNELNIQADLYKPLPKYVIVDYEAPKTKKHELLPIGSKAPEIEGYFLLDSTEFLLSNYLDTSLVLLDFWYQSCGPCIQAIPYLDSLEQEFGPEGFLLIEVNSRDHETDKSELIDFLNKRGGSAEMVIMTDSNTERKTWKCNSNPTFYLIKNGEIIWTHVGFSPQLMAEFRVVIEQELDDN